MKLSNWKLVLAIAIATAMAWGTPTKAFAGGFNQFGRAIGLGWSDGYHSRTGCPDRCLADGPRPLSSTAYRQGASVPGGPPLFQPHFEHGSSAKLGTWTPGMFFQQWQSEMDMGSSNFGHTGLDTGSGVSPDRSFGEPTPARKPPQAEELPPVKAPPAKVTAAPSGRYFTPQTMPQLMPLAVPNSTPRYADRNAYPLPSQNGVQRR